MNKIVFLMLIAPSIAFAVEVIDAKPKGCAFIEEVESMSQVSLTDSKIALKEAAAKVAANVIHLQESKGHLVTTHDLPDMTLYISKGMAYKCAKP